MIEDKRTSHLFERNMAKSTATCTTVRRLSNPGSTERGREEVPHIYHHQGKLKRLHCRLIWVSSPWAAGATTSLNQDKAHPSFLLITETT